MNLTIKPLIESNYCNCFHLTSDEVGGGISERAAALGGEFDSQAAPGRRAMRKKLK